MKRVLFSLFLGSLACHTVFAQWTMGADIPEGIRAGNTESYVFEGIAYFYIFGGRNDQGEISNKYYRYSLDFDQWDDMGEMPAHILGSSSARLGDDIFIIGGGSVTPGPGTRTVYKYNIPTNAWEQKADFPINFSDGDGTAYQDSLIYTVGAYNHDRTYVYNKNTDQWRQGTSVPSPGFALSYGALSTSGDKLVYVGGSNGTFSSTYWNTTWIGEIDQNDRSQITWTEGTPFPGQTRTFFELRPWDNGLILIGGTTDNTFGTFSDENYFYNVSADTWTQLTPKPTAWNTGNAASVFSNNKWKLFCSGGFAIDYLPNTEIYTQKNLGNVRAEDGDLCHLRNFQIIRGANPKLYFCTKENGLVGMFIWDGQSRLVRERKEIAINAGDYLISLNDLDLPGGIYFITLTQNGYSHSQKVQILH